MAEIHLGQFAAAQIDNHQPAAMGQKRDLLWQVVAADDIDHHIDAATLGGSAADRGEILGLVIDRMVGAKCSHRGAFLVTARGGKDSGTMRVGDLDCGAANAAGAALDQDALARGEGAAVHHVGPDRAEHFRQSGSIGQGYAVGDGHALPFGCQRIFRIAATDQKRAYAVADLKAAATVANGNNGAGRLQPHDIRRTGRDRIFSFAFA